jgi:hypothetical protein
LHLWWLKDHHPLKSLLNPLAFQNLCFQQLLLLITASTWKIVSFNDRDCLCVILAWLYPHHLSSYFQSLHHVVARIPAMSGMCSWEALVVGERVPGRPRTKSGTPRLRYLFVLLGTKHFTLRIRRYGAATLYTHVEQ